MSAAAREDCILRMVSRLEIGSIIRTCFLCRRKVWIHWVLMRVLEVWAHNAKKKKNHHHHNHKTVFQISWKIFSKRKQKLKMSFLFWKINYTRGTIYFCMFDPQRMEIGTYSFTECLICAGHCDLCWGYRKIRYPHPWGCQIMAEIQCF